MSVGMFLLGFIIGAVAGVILVSSTSVSSNNSRIREENEMLEELIKEELDEDLKPLDK